ncbi:MAG TPA: cation:proton antiporter, partial [Rhizomicrobium sp.]|nr:cation:proton antiporter [Rhizomicrobium sp.]
DVQTGPPGSGEKGEVRFALTSEAGLNDGLAFPFVMLALALAQVGTVSWGWWFTVDLIGKLVAAVVIGWAGGRAMGWVLFRLPDLSLSRTGDGLVALGVTLMAYATAQMLHAYGFVTVFAAAVAIRASAPNHAFHGAMAQFSDQVERMLLMLVLVVFGAATSAGLLQSLNWAQVVTGLALIFAVRPLSAWLAFAGSELTWQPKALIAFFGIRGIGTLYYLFYAFRHGAVTGQTAIWNVAGFTILVSILLHGTTSTPLMEWAARIRMRRH